MIDGDVCTILSKLNLGCFRNSLVSPFELIWLSIDSTNNRFSLLSHQFGEQTLALYFLHISHNVPFQALDAEIVTIGFPR